MFRSGRGLSTHNLLACLVLALASAGCGARSRAPLEFHRLVVDNASADVIRVSLRLDDREIHLGRVDPMSKEVFRVRPGTLPPAPADARILIVPIGSPEPVVLPSRRSEAIQSDSYTLTDLLKYTWRFSGSRVQMLGPLGDVR